MQTITVFCASSSKISPCYFEAARKFGRIMAEAQIRCCNGAGGIGLMGALSDSVMEHGGEVIGIIPKFMCDMNWHHPSLTQIEVVDNMHIRKERMISLSDAIVALPGGCGTLEELTEVVTLKQLGLYLNPIIILNINDFYTPLLDFFEKMIKQNFMLPTHRKMWQVIKTPEEILPAIATAEKWDKNIRKIAAI